MSRGRSRNPSQGQPKADQPRRGDAAKPAESQTAKPGQTEPKERPQTPVPPPAAPKAAAPAEPPKPSGAASPATPPGSPSPAAASAGPAAKPSASPAPGAASSPAPGKDATPAKSPTPGGTPASAASGKPVETPPRAAAAPSHAPTSAGKPGEKPDRPAAASSPASAAPRPSAAASSTKSAPPPPPPPAKSSGGYIPGIVGGVVGAVLVGFGMPLVQGPPPLAPDAEQRVAAVETSTTTLDERLAATSTELATANEQLAGLGELSANLENTVQTAVAAAVEEIPSRDGAAIAALGERVDAVAATADELVAAAAAATDPVPLLEAQAQRLEALQAALTSLDNRLASEVLRLEAARTDTATGLQSSIDETKEAVEAARQAATAELEAARTTLAEGMTAFESDLEAVRGDLASLRTTVDDMQLARNRAAAAALLVRDIDRSIAAGETFADPLDRLRAMGAGDAGLEATLASLEPAAESGVPTIDELRQGLVALEAREAPAPIGGSEWLGRTVGNITGLVEVRDRDTDGEAATGLLGEADAALRQGDLETAIARVESTKTMPDGPDPAAIDAWLAEARARATAVAALAELDAQIRDLLTATVN